MRIPWKIRNAIRITDNACSFINKRVSRLFHTPAGKKRIVFHCAFQGITGATIATARIANLLAKRYQVDFIAGPFSNYQPMLSNRVSVFSPAKLAKTRYDLYVCDGHTDLAVFEQLAAESKKCLITYHGVQRKDNNLEKVYLASKAHLVGEVQFMHHTVDRARYFVIPNYCEPIDKHHQGNNVGIVGRIEDPNKNVAEALMIARQSAASEIHLWGSAESERMDQRVVYHAWSRNKQKIYNTFDVLISMSKEESMGMTVIEAMSCGIPCVLADIPGFQIYRGCPGIALVPLGQIQAAVICVNQFLSSTAAFKEPMMQYWRQHYSESAIAGRWYAEIDGLLS